MPELEYWKWRATNTAILCTYWLSWRAGRENIWLAQTERGVYLVQTVLSMTNLIISRYKEHWRRNVVTGFKVPECHTSCDRWKHWYLCWIKQNKLSCNDQVCQCPQCISFMAVTNDVTSRRTSHQKKHYVMTTVKQVNELTAGKHQW